MSRCVTLYRLGGVGVWWWGETAGIDVTRRAESIGEGISSRGDAYMPQPEITPVSRNVTLCGGGVGWGCPGPEDTG